MALLSQVQQMYPELVMHCRSGDGQASQEDEGLFACRAALLRLHHLQLLCKAPAEDPDLYTNLHKLVEVGFC